MSVIRRVDFIAVADSIARARLCQLEVNSQLLDCVNTIVDLDQTYLDVEIDLLYQFYQSYSAAVSGSVIPANLLSDISTLHQHVIDRATDASGNEYDDINDWLRDESIQVMDTYADMSEEAGWPIDHDRIKADETISFS